MIRKDLICSVVLAAVAAFGVQGSAAWADPSPADGKAAAANDQPASSSVDAQSYKIETVTVTAEKRETKLHDTAMAITALSGSDLSARDAESFDDYAPLVPGLTATDEGPSRKKYVIRGVQSQLGTGTLSPTVGQYLDEVPLTASGVTAEFGVSEPDPILTDVQQVEVLRGPQGTLYGAGSMGGTVRTITNKPDLDAFGGWAAATMSFTANANRPNYLADLVLNAPIIDGTLGFRGMLHFENFAGFIDNIRIGKNNVNSDQRWAGRFMLRWQPSSNLDIEAFYQHQDMNADGSWRTDVASGQLKQNTPILEPYQDKLDIANITAYYHTAIGTFTSATSYVKRNDSADKIDQELDTDFTNLGAFGVFPLGPGAFADGTSGEKSVSQEVRLTSDADDDARVQYLLGAFYTNKSDQAVQDLYDVNGVINSILTTLGGPGAATAPQGSTDPIYVETTHEKEKDFAAFGELTVKLAPGLKATAGLRYYDIQYRFVDDLSKQPCFPILGAPPPCLPETNILPSNAHGFNYRFNVSWDIDENNMVYAQAAQGFRRGGVNVASEFRTFVPEAYAPDSLWSYEAGWKTILFDGRLTANTSIYQIDWSNIQIDTLLTNPAMSAFSFGVVNSGDARIRGIEFEPQLQVTEALTVGGSLSYVDAELVNSAPGDIQPYRGLPGDRLPGDPRWQGALSANYTKPISTDWMLRLGGDFTYIDDRNTDLRPVSVAGPLGPAGVANPNFFVMKGYSTLNLRAALVGPTWEISAFANNLGNTRADQELYLPFDQTGAKVQRIPIRPRTIGITVKTSF